MKIPEDTKQIQQSLCDLEKDIQYLKTRTDEKFIGIDGRLKATDIRIAELDKYHDRKLWQFLMTGFAGLVTLITVMLTMDAKAEPIETISTTTQTVNTNGNMTTTVKQPPPSAISPQFSSGSNSDLCTIGVAGAVQTQILGISAGTTMTEENCVRLKNAKTLADMGMKVAAVSLLCTDEQIFLSMERAGTPCPVDGQVGKNAQLIWDTTEYRPYKSISTKSNIGEDIDVEETAVMGGLGMLGWLLLL